MCERQCDALATIMSAMPNQANWRPFASYSQHTGPECARSTHTRYCSFTDAKRTGCAALAGTPRSKGEWRTMNPRTRKPGPEQRPPPAHQFTRCGCLTSDQSLEPRQQLAPGRYAQMLENAVDVGLRRAQAYRQRVGYLLIAHPFREKLHNLALPQRQAQRSTLSSRLGGSFSFSSVAVSTCLSA